MPVGDFGMFTDTNWKRRRNDSVNITTLTQFTKLFYGSSKKRAK
jgi:hypothetical protein